MDKERNVRHDLRLLAIAGDPEGDAERIVSSCLSAEDGGVTAVQLRLKDAASGHFLDLAFRLKERLGVPLWINDRADIAVAADAVGVHVGWDDLPPSAIRGLAGGPIAIGVSVGAPDEARWAMREEADYWSIGAMFATETKPDAGAPIGPAGFQAIAAMAPSGMPTIAIGGISEANAHAVLEAGAHGIAVSRAVFGAVDVAGAARRLRAIIDRY